jgi:hypothetical protein
MCEQETQTEPEPRDGLIHREGKNKFIRYIADHRHVLPKKCAPLALLLMYKRDTGVDVSIQSARRYLNRAYTFINDEAFY